MNANAIRPGRSVMLVGSVPLEDAADVFAAVGRHLGGCIKRVPDGETGGRIHFIRFQEAVFDSAHGLERKGYWDVAGKPSPLFGLKAGFAEGDVRFGSLGYADAALVSYREFQAARQNGDLRDGVRLQVSLPTPLTIAIKYADRASFAPVFGAYEAAMRRELDQMFGEIPHRHLAIQWDAPAEVHTLLEDRVPELTKLVAPDAVVAALAHMIDCVPTDVEVGAHFCYGDSEHKHIVEPRDTQTMVWFANALAAKAARALDWIHMPVPSARYDDAYYAPLRNLHLRPETELYLGLVHFGDGLDGARRRMAAAGRAYPDFGLATECGLGRRPPETIEPLLEIHRLAAEGRDAHER